MHTKRSWAASLICAVAVSVGVTVQSPAPASANPGRVCDRFCDGRDPALARADRVPQTATVFGRELEVHVNDRGSMAWASIEHGNPGDEVWLDRSFDGGRTWADGSRLGSTKIPDRNTGWRTGQFNVDDWRNHGVGAVRACGKAGDRDDIACTAWTRSTQNAADRAQAATTALMMRYDRNTGLFGDKNWWTSASALTAVIQNGTATRMGSYRYAIANTYDKQVGSKQGQFRNEFLDDTGWWGLAWIAAYDVTHDQRYLDTARADADWMHRYWDNTCGGGVWWKTDKKQKNAIENSLYIQLNAALAQRTEDDTYKQRAQAGWNWFQGAGLINKDHLVNDGLDPATCKNNGGQTWTYNQGVLVNALTELSKATGDTGNIQTARDIANTVTATGSKLSPAGVLQEPPNGDPCDKDGAAFKGPAIRGISALNKQLGGEYNGYLKYNADTAYGYQRDSLDNHGFEWAATDHPHQGTGVSCQLSAVDLFNAAAG